jgi:hypothetical protein
MHTVCYTHPDSFIFLGQDKNKRICIVEDMAQELILDFGQ